MHFVGWVKTCNILCQVNEEIDFKNEYILQY